MALPRVHLVSAALLFFSGSAALIDEHLLSKLLERVVGSSAEGVAAVLVAFIGGMGLGARLAAPRVARLPRAFRAYALVELGIALSVLVLPTMLSLVSLGYATVGRAAGTGSAVVVLRFVAAVLVAAVPGLLMGATFPLLTEAARRASPGSPPPLPTFYAANTLGAAAGVLASTYALVPRFGLRGSLAIAAGCNLLVALGALVLDRRFAAAPAPAEEERPKQGLAPTLSLSRAQVIAFGSGLLAFALEVVWFRLLGTVVGSSVYAFGLMLFVFLLGNALGGALAEARRLGRPLVLPLAQATVGLTVLMTAPLWDDVPGLFRQVGRYAPSFALWEITRFVGAVGLLVLPTLAMGCAFGLLLRFAAGTDVRAPERVGRLYAFNMVGAIGGALLATFVLAPAVGSQISLVLLALAETALAALALTPSVGSLRRRVAWAAGLGSAAVALLFSAEPWNIARLISGSNVYFSEAFTEFERLRFLDEDRSGGLVAVVEREGVRTLLSNGKFEGNDGFEVPDQQLFALLPLLFVKEHGTALNIGVGTGNSLAVMGAFPFQRLDAVDLSAAALAAARREFAHLNRGVLEDPRVRVHVQDGRNFLLTTSVSYDLIVIQLSSIWIGGTADLYNREFYELARKRMTPRGVFKQWIQLHHIQQIDMARIIGTLRAVFPHVTLWVGGHQGVLVASAEPLRADARALARWPKVPSIARVLQTSGLDHPYSAFGHFYLGVEGVDSLLYEVAAKESRLPEDLVSTDDGCELEFSTPRGNVLTDALGDNMELLRRHATASPLSAVAGLGDAERRLFLAYAARQRGFTQLAALLLRPVAGRFAVGEHAGLVQALQSAGGDRWP